MDQLLTRLRQDFTNFSFISGPTFSWSAKHQAVIIPEHLTDDLPAIWSLLHEVGHATLGHRTYASDFELVKLEAAAWQQAVKLGQQYGHTVDAEHIQDCLDTYRDWLHQRSTCPVCHTVSLQMTTTQYCCYNCNANWGVSRSRLCRPYRRLHVNQTKTAPA